MEIGYSNSYVEVELKYSEETQKQNNQIEMNWNFVRNLINQELINLIGT